MVLLLFVPTCLMYSNAFSEGKYLGESTSYNILGAIIVENFKIKQNYYNINEILEKTR